MQQLYSWPIIHFLKTSGHAAIRFMVKTMSGEVASYGRDGDDVALQHCNSVYVTIDIVFHFCRVSRNSTWKIQ